MKQIKIYFACLHTAFSRAAAYRADFVLGNFISLISNIFFPLLTVVIYSNGASFPDWGMWEVMLIQSVFAMSSGVSLAVWNGLLWVTMDHIREGSFETVLLKPVSPLLYLTATGFDPESFGMFIGGTVLTVISACHTGISGWSGMLLFSVLFISGLAVMSGLYMIMAAVSFKWVGNSRIPEIFDSVKEFGKYPIGIFPKGVQILSALVVPVAVIGFFPASALMGRLEVRALLSVIPCVLFFLFGKWLYNKMIKLYEGVGG